MKKLVLVMVGVMLLSTGCMADYVKNVVLEDAPQSSTEPIELQGGGTLPSAYMNEDIEYLGFCTEDGLVALGEDTNLVSDLIYVDAQDFTTSSATEASGAYIGDYSKTGHVVATKPVGEDTQVAVVDITYDTYTVISTHDRTAFEVQPHFTDDTSKVAFVINEDGQSKVMVYDVLTQELKTGSMSDLLPQEWVATAQDVQNVKLHYTEEDEMVLSLVYMSKPYIVVNDGENAYALNTASQEAVVVGGSIFHINPYRELTQVDIENDVSYKLATGVEEFCVSADGNTIVYQTVDENDCSMLYLMDFETGESGLADVRSGVHEFQLSPEGEKLYIKYTDSSSFEPVDRFVVREF